MSKTIHVGTISKLDLIRAPKGHIPRAAGCGIFRNRRADKKLRRLNDRQESKP